MILTRTTARIVKPWICLVRARCSGLKQTTYFPRWPAVTGQDHQSRWVFGKSKGYDLPTLEEFIGTWHETKQENYVEYLKAAEIPDSQIDFVTKNFTWIAYEKSGNVWICSYGLLNASSVHAIQFEMGKHFKTNAVSGEPTKSLIYQEGKKMMELHETENPPKRVIKMERKIKGKDKMVVRLERNNVEAVRKFKRVPDDPTRKVTFEM